MARVLIETQAWMPIDQAFGNSRVILISEPITIKNTDGTAATTWSAQTVGTSSTATQTTDNRGLIASRWIEEGEYDVTVKGVARRVEATSGTPRAEPVVDVWGHSYGDGLGVVHMGDSFPERLGPLAGAAAVRNHAISGSTLATMGLTAGVPFGAGGFQRMVLTLPWAGTTVQPALINVAALYHGINDCQGTATASADGKVVREYLRACICKLRHVMGDQTSGASWAFAQAGGASNWGASTTNGQLTPASRPTGANGNTWTITLPSTFPGGTIEVFSFTNNAGGSLHAVTLDSVAYGNWDTRTADSATNRPFCFRLTDLAAGAHTIQGTIGSRVGSEWMMYWTSSGIGESPTVMYANINRAPAYPNAMTDAAVATVNGLITPLAAEFSDGRVVCVDMDTALGYTTASGVTTNFDMVGLGGGVAGVHPNALGHGLVAREFGAAFRTRFPSDTTLARSRHLGGNLLWLPTLSESAGAGSTQSDPHHRDRCAVLTMVAGTVTWINRAIDANTRVGGLTAIGDPTGGTAGTVGIVSITASATTVPGTIVIKSTNAADVRPVHIWIYQADPVTPTVIPPSHY